MIRLLSCMVEDLFHPESNSTTSADFDCLDFVWLYALAIIGSAIDWHSSLMQTKSDKTRLHVYSNPLVMTYNDNRLRKPLPAQLISHYEFSMTLTEILGEWEKLLNAKNHVALLPVS